MNSLVRKINAVKCLNCGDIIESTYAHEFKWCSCGDIAVDGGSAYNKRVFTEKAHWLELEVKEERNKNDD